MQEPKFFRLEELLKSDTALTLAIENLPSWADVCCLNRLAVDVLDPIRSNWGEPLIVTSGYRSPELNIAVYGVSGSAHLVGSGVDVALPSWSTRRLLDLFNLIESMVENELIDIDQVIYYRKKKYIHISNDVLLRKEFIIK